MSQVMDVRCKNFKTTPVDIRVFSKSDNHYNRQNGVWFLVFFCFLFCCFCFVIVVVVLGFFCTKQKIKKNLNKSKDLCVTFLQFTLNIPCKNDWKFTVFFLAREGLFLNT